VRKSERVGMFAAIIVALILAIRALIHAVHGGAGLVAAENAIATIVALGVVCYMLLSWPREQ